MDLNNLLKSTKCVCGIEMMGKYLKPPFIRDGIPKGYYGGRVKKMMKAVCECGREYIALLDSGHNSYSVIDLIPLEIDVKEVRVPERPSYLTSEVIKEELAEYLSMKKEEPTDSEPDLGVELSEDIPFGHNDKPDLGAMKRNDLLALAKKMKIAGNVTFMKNIALIPLIKEKMENAEKTGRKIETPSDQEGIKGET